MSRPLLSRLLRRLDPDRPTAHDRRTFLKMAAAAGAGLVLSADGFAAAPRSGRVLVAGAGFAGLAAAFELRAAGFDAHVYEARDRVGGRVLSVRGPAPMHEGGAELIGSNHPRWSHYAERFGLELRELSDAGGEEVIVVDGRALDAREQARLWRGIVKVLRRLTAAARPVDGAAPWLAAGAATLDALDLQTWLDRQGLDPLANRFLSRLLAADAAVPTAEQSVLGMLATISGGGGRRYWTESEVYRCAGGNQQLAERLAAGLGADAVHLGAPIRDIRWGAGQAALTLADGATVEGDAVVCALPASVWPDITFDPPLPPELRPRMGTAVKHLSRLSRPVWADTGRSPDAYSDGVIAMTWDGSDGQPGDARWLVAFSGAASADAGLALDAAPREAAYTAEAERLFPGFEAAVVERRYYDWPNDPRACAGYSCPGVGEVTTARRALHDGLFPLVFAGEHTSTAFPGYMEGALESGGRAARQLVERLG
jgi:monoamine oxidase